MHVPRDVRAQVQDERGRLGGQGAFRVYLGAVRLIFLILVERRARLLICVHDFDRKRRPPQPKVKGKGKAKAVVDLSDDAEEVDDAEPDEASDSSDVVLTPSKRSRNTRSGRA